MALHQVIQRLLLVGVRFEKLPAPPPPQPPQRLLPLIESIAVAHRKFDQRAIHYGHRYRSGFWAIYLLSAIAVLCAVMPLALGWDSAVHAMHPFSGLWAVAEVLVIGSVSAIYWLGHRRDWQGEWLRARTTAELIGYLPMLAPLVDFRRSTEEADWYLRVFDPGQNLRGNREVTTLCRRHEGAMRAALASVWADPQFVAAYADWAASILESQEYYHRSVALRQHVLKHRIHTVNIWLFGLTALGALTHLILHSLYLSIVTTFFPALGASLHGALAQSEAYRLEVASDRLAKDLRLAVARIREAAAGPEPAARKLAGAGVAFVTDAAAVARLVRDAVESALSLILEEHQDWHMLVRPHRLPLG